jgi:hypothetical protein
MAPKTLQSSIKQINRAHIERAFTGYLLWVLSLQMVSFLKTRS